MVKLILGVTSLGLSIHELNAWNPEALALSIEGVHLILFLVEEALVWEVLLVGIFKHHAAVVGDLPRVHIKEEVMVCQ